MRVGIFGTGGLGGFFGAKLAAAGHDVVFIARGAHLEALRRDGLQIASIDGDFTIDPVHATDSPAEAGACDVVLVTVKGWQIADVTAAIGPMLHADTVVVPLLNGVEAPAQLAEALGSERVVGGLAKIVAFIEGPGRIRHQGIEPYIAVGELDQRPSERLELLCEALRNAGITAEVVPDIHAALWEKFLFVVGWGGVGAITRAPVGAIRHFPPTRALLEQSMSEIATVALARQINLPSGAVSKSLAFLDALPPAGTTSMQRDIADGRPSELESWNGAVVRLAREAGVETPLHRFVYASLLPQERAARGQE